MEEYEDGELSLTIFFSLVFIGVAALMIMVSYPKSFGIWSF